MRILFLKYFLFLCYIFHSFTLYSQGRYLSLSKEVWSKPEFLFRGNYPSVTGDGRKLYFYNGDLVYSELTDTGWSEPKITDERLNWREVYLQCLTVSYDGSKIFFGAWTSYGWWTFYMEWDSSKNRWGEIKDPGPWVNNPYYFKSATFPGSMPDDTTLYVIRSSTIWICHYNKETGKFDTSYIIHDLADYGISVTGDKRKIYRDYFWGDTTGGRYKSNFDIAVGYYVEDIDGAPSYINYDLHFSLETDSLYYSGVYKGLWEAYPAVTLDGKRLFYVADYDGENAIYMRRLLIDEKGEPVSVQKDDVDDEDIGYRINSIYPNPFNNFAFINYYVPEESYIRISLFDSAGRFVRRIYDGIKSAGEHVEVIDAGDLSSGMYIVVFDFPYGYKTSKILLIK